MAGFNWQRVHIYTIFDFTCCQSHFMMTFVVQQSVQKSTNHQAIRVQHNGLLACLYVGIAILWRHNNQSYSKNPNNKPSNKLSLLHIPLLHTLSGNHHKTRKPICIRVSYLKIDSHGTVKQTIGYNLKSFLFVNHWTYTNFAFSPFFGLAIMVMKSSVN